MEKNFKLRSKILKILPSINLTFQNNPFSPGTNHKSKQDNTKNWARPHKGFSGPIISIKPKGINGIENEEPTSPKISCMGQIKHKKKQIKKVKDIVEVKKHVTTFQKMLLHVGKPKSEGRRKKSDATAAQDNKYALEERATHLSQMKRFASGRGTFANFDWKAQVVADEIDYYSDEEIMNGDDDDDDDDDDDEEEEFMIPFSAPLLVGGGGVGVLDNLKPRKEINLWKRRTMAPPRPLQLDQVH